MPENDIVNASDLSGSGDQRLGRIVVKTGGRGSNGTQANTEPQYVEEIADVSGKFDERFDDPRYYTGDAPT